MRRVLREITWVRLLIAIVVLNAIYWLLEPNLEWAASHGLADAFDWTLTATTVVAYPITFLFWAKFFFPKSP